MTMKQAQAKCRRWREKGDKKSLRKADKLQARFKDHRDYEDVHTWLLRVQSGELFYARRSGVA